ncbi:MAG TPA: glycosyl hydrolase, partial [Thermoanaerobaculia bacterium]|nr:glycosyl hydrolase [Thermoanaerobaculia bacterium]
MSRFQTFFFVVLALCVPPARAATPDPLASGFAAPPRSAAPRTWWHWVDGNVSREGITLDLEAMKQAGIAGATVFNVSMHIPRGPVPFLSDRWRQLTAFAVKEAARLGMDLGIHNCAGWSSSAGPWITPEQSMQVIAWSEVRVRGPRAFDERLPPIKAPRKYEQVPYSRDIAVFAFRTPARRRERLADDGRFLAATGVIRKANFDPDPTPETSTPPVGRFVNLTSAMDRDGRLSWYVPDGDWTILRIGHVANGKTNHVAPAEGEGLEVDKLSREAVTAHWAGMMARVIADAGPLAGKTLNEVLIDSYEVGSQNWTPQFREEFRKRCGYDCFPWLPALTGIVVESQEKTARFLWDYRRTIADLYADNYFGTFATLARKAGMRLAVEAYGNGGFDDVEAAGRVDVPMGEFGAHGQGPVESVKLAASAGHIYGKPVIAAESFTTGDPRDALSLDPYSVKAVGDRMFCQGVNRCVFHTYVHQPWRGLVPGMTMGR